ncbi:MAG: bis(5'-nucleosyl)-tetraphosphatase (symmetrical) YqeK [Eubacteriales bacterium]|nr:bis(5'-nucleosyl)-tetraphosphatase (symmetrical) YqeK [Eubacteriales bacterium]
MIKIGLIGGTFDPFHNGHRKLVEAVLESGLVDRVVLMVAGQQPHKTKLKVSAAGYRYEMALRGVSDLDMVEVSDLEIRRSGRSYTVDTLALLRHELSPDDQIILVYGSDVLFDLPSWRFPEKILAAADLLIAHRGGIRPQDAQSQADLLQQQFNARIRFLDAPMLELSATEVREAAVRGELDTGKIPERVAALITRHDLYGYDDELALVEPAIWHKLSDYECQVRPLLNHKRLLHSLNVMRYAMHLAHKHGVSVEKAGIAGLMHDCAKCLEAHTVLHYARLAGDPELLEPALAHGPAGAWLARHQFGIEDPEILQAIFFHTTGSSDMSDLDLLIYVADKVEPARTYHNLEAIREAAETDLVQAMRLCLVEVEAFLARENKPSHPYAQAALVKLGILVQQPEQTDKNPPGLARKNKGEKN